MSDWYQRFHALDRKNGPAIRTFLATPDTDGYHVFLQMIVEPHASDALMVQRMGIAEKTLRKLTAYDWGSGPKRRNFEALAADPKTLGAVQAAAARGTAIGLDLLAVLVMDGSTDSIDALLPHLDPALSSADRRLDRLKRLKTYAGSAPAIAKIFAEITETLDARNAASPALAYGPVIGIGEVKTLWFSVRISSREENPNRVPSIQGDIDLDSTSVTWFRVWMSRVEPDSLGRDRERVDFTNAELRADTFGVGRCTPDQLPQWFAAAAKKLGMKLELGDARTNLRGKKRDQLMTWLNSGARAAGAKRGGPRRR